MKDQAKWERPALVVLGRGRPGEAVLGHCKTPIEAGPFGQCEPAGGCALVGAS
jgi:hypothetical protein